MFCSVLEDNLSPDDSQDFSDEGSDQNLRALYESDDSGNYVDASDASKLILRSKDGNNFTYLLDIEETQKLNNGAEVYSLSDNPQTTIHVEFSSKYIYIFLKYFCPVWPKLLKFNVYLYTNLI